MGLFLLASLVSCNSNADYKVVSEVPDITMPENGLAFKTIEDYKTNKPSTLQTIKI